jgi:hypothetical protein
LEFLREILQDAQLLVPLLNQRPQPPYFLPEPLVLTSQHGEIPLGPREGSADVAGIVPAGTPDPKRLRYR